MNKVVCYFFVFVSLISFLMVNIGSASSPMYFSDDFTGNVLDSGVWTFTDNVQGNSLTPYGGRIDVADSLVTLSSVGNSFPFVNSKVNPFPSTGDFVLELKITYTGFTDRGDGFWISQGAYSSNPNNRILEMWADSGYTAGIKLYLLDKQPIVFALISQTFDLRLEYISGIYTLYNNGVQLLPSVISVSRPTYIGFGHPQISGVPLDYSSQETPWTSFNIDYIRIFQTLTLVTPEYPIGTIMCVASAFGAFAVFSQLRKRKANRITTL